jgi:HAD superfamily hydrolase (TIGR01490 family)
VTEALGVGAYVDVDDTLVRGVTMFDFLRYDAARTGRVREGADHLAALARCRDAGAPRTETSRLYYRWWAGRRASEITALAASWWRERLAGADLFNTWVFSRWRWHGERGHRRVLVSGSFHELLTPLAERIGADAVIATTLCRGADRLSGEVEEPMVGSAKREAVLQDTSRAGVCLLASYGYGDHVSDLAFMSLLGHSNLITKQVMPSGEPTTDRHLDPVTALDRGVGAHEVQ